MLTITSTINRTVRYKTVNIEGVKIFYREAGNPDAPTILLLHGFPSSSHMYRDLINDLSDEFHLIAPDYPGFGNSDMPSRSEYSYTFDNLSVTIEKFIDALQLQRFALFMQDFGAPVGYRIALRRPELIEALLIQNANAYEEGLGPATEDGQRLWANRNETTEAPMRQMMSLEGTMMQYLDGAEDPSRISPDAYHYDQYFLEREGNKDIQVDLLYDYRNNITQYPQWQEYLKTNQPPALITWGKNDALFTAAGAIAYKKDLPDAELHLLNTGHFALEEFHFEIAKLIKSFLNNLNLFR
ncbi:alpha/beta fold hydrolase [Pinibacter aurantiacus]|uniref:Alpha/beta hydrolase n=1 Tax=Pinibacter aurantiacus TaxID=2851599 RepID=A0A9E2S724_9BACT|nr:alpha/beta hydrolase [Pinibacter aurantiacus]MBV4357011.1 alpha/beta hydrolase [Pinibacter aurantiacus]